MKLNQDEHQNQTTTTNIDYIKILWSIKRKFNNNVEIASEKTENGKTYFSSIEKIWDQSMIRHGNN